MIIPQAFRDTVAKKFYDKTLDVYSVSNTVDDEGWVAISGSSVISSTFKGNVRFSKLEIIRQQYGIQEQIDAVVTTNSLIATNTIVGYLGRQYKVIQSIPFDSHNLLILQKWLSKSSTSISA